MFSRLNINGVDVVFTEELPISTNLSIADVRYPDTRSAAFTKTISIPGTAEVIELFEYIFEVNVELQTFNPNIKTPAAYFTNEIKEFFGSLELLSITLRYDGKESITIFNCNIIGTQGDLFLNLTDKYITGSPNNIDPITGISSDDIDVSDLNHVLNYTNFSAVPTLGVGYCYGYIDYGLNNLNSSSWNVKDMKAAIFEKEYIDRIFKKAGKTYTSTFFNSNYYAHIAVPDINAGRYKFTAADLSNLQFYAGKTTPQGLTPISGTFIPVGSLYLYPQGSVNPVVSNDDSTPPFGDPGGIYNAGTGVYTTSVINPQAITFVLNYSVSLSAILTATTFRTSPGAVQVTIEIYKNGTSIGASYSQPYSSTTIFPVTGGNAVIGTSASFTYNSGALVVGDTFQCVITSISVLGGWYNSGGTIIATGLPSTATYSIDSTLFYNNLLSTDLTFGDTINMNNTLPPLIKQADFLKSVFIEHNLYVEQDKADPNNYIIEPRDGGFYTGASLDWTKKQDLSQDIEILPMGELDARSYTFSRKTDEDYWNKKYQDAWKETYGQQLVNVANDFVTDDKKIESIFSSTPAVAYVNNIVAPRLLSIEGAAPGTGASFTTKPLKCNIRRLYWGGMKPCAPHLLKFSAGSTVLLTQYPSLNHFDDAYSPTLDLNFGPPKEIYWQLPSQIITSNNLYNRFYSKFITEITDKNSKIVKTYMVLEELDIANFSFRKIVFINDAYYYVNSISDYDPQVRKAVLVELLKLKAGPEYVPFNYPPWNPPAGQSRTISSSPIFNEQNNYAVSGSGLIVGANMYQGANTGIITGNNSRVNTPGNFDGIGLHDFIAGPEYEGTFVVRNDAFRVSDGGIEKLKLSRAAEYTADFFIAKPISYVNAATGNIKITLPQVHDEVEVTIVRTDNSGNTVTVYGFAGTELILSTGISGTTDTINNTTKKTYSTDGTSWYF